MLVTFLLPIQNVAVFFLILFQNGIDPVDSTLAKSLACKKYYIRVQKIIYFIKSTTNRNDETDTAILDDRYFLFPKKTVCFASMV